jgi:hypothetical protein
LVQGWGWAVPYFLTWPLSYPMHQVVGSVLDSSLAALADHWRVVAASMAEVLFYFTLGPIYIWFLVRGYLALVNRIFAPAKQ